MNAIVLVLGLVLSTGALAAPSESNAGRLKQRIVGGVDASRGQFSYEVSIQTCYPSGTYCWHSCAGTIIDSQIVVTAAQCIPSSWYTLNIVAGILNLNESVAQSQNIPVAQHHIHPGYTSQNGDYHVDDIAILFLSRKLIFNTQIQPAKLPNSRSYPTGYGIFSGWGSTSGGFLAAMPNTLQTIQAKILDIQTCINEFEKVNPSSKMAVDRNGRHICTSPGTGVSACFGDGGDPLVNANGILLGVASWINSPCGLTGPTVFTNVGYYVDWIFSQMSWWYSYHY